MIFKKSVLDFTFKYHVFCEVILNTNNEMNGRPHTFSNSIFFGMKKRFRILLGLNDKKST